MIEIKFVIFYLLYLNSIILVFLNFIALKIK